MINGPKFEIEQHKKDFSMKPITTNLCMPDHLKQQEGNRIDDVSFPFSEHNIILRGETADRSRALAVTSGGVIHHLHKG